MTYLAQYLSKTPENTRDNGAVAFFAKIDLLKESSPQIADAILQELKDQRAYLKLIASENYSSLAVQMVMGTLLTDKYSEGVVKKRFYAGCDNVDTVEGLAVERAKKLFKADHAYVQPHSGADANMVAFWSILVKKIQNAEVEKLGKKTLEELTDEEYEKIRQLLMNQKLLGMSLQSGGHLTHGYRQNLSSKMMRAFSYDVDFKTGLLDYKTLEKRAKEVKPLILLAGYSAYPRMLNFAKIKEIADSVGAVLMVDMAHFAGLVAGKVFTGEYDPVAYADIVTSTTHKTLRGPRGGIILCKEEYKEVVDKGCPLVLGGPLPHVMAAKAIAFQEALSPDFEKYAHQIVKNAQALASQLMTLGCKVLTGGTDNHMLLVNVKESFGLTGRQAESALFEVLLTVNRNAIPQDPNGPWYTSGIRMGTPALTTRGFQEEQMKEIAKIFTALLKKTKSQIVEGKPSLAKVDIDPDALKQAKMDVGLLTSAFPLYPELNIPGVKL
jgi:glycine hydroxymethyltransferase